jgi:endoribonuclease LACTB2
LTDREPKPFPCERIEVPNSGFMREQPTNSYILGASDLIIVDPGSEVGETLIAEAVSRRRGARVSAIVLTHAHPDHAAAAGALKRRYACPLMAHDDGRPIAGKHLAWTDVDTSIRHGDPLVVEGYRFEAILTPGHAPGHVALWHAPSKVMIAGDLVSGNGTIGVFPPHGSMREYLDSLRCALELGPAMMLPGHGPRIDEPVPLLEYYIERRLGREQEILGLLARNGSTIADLLPEIYPDILPAYTFPAEATILAHLLKLESESRVRLKGDDALTGRWTRTQ